MGYLNNVGIVQHVVGAGFVHVAMFRRPLLSILRQIWRMKVESLDTSPQQRHWVRQEVLIELVRFMGLSPLSHMNFRSPFMRR